MQLLKQLNEQASELEDVRELALAIMHAADFFKQRSEPHQWLYRGTSDKNIPDSNFVQIITPRSDRKPKDMDRYTSGALDVALKERFGTPFRSAGVFVTGDVTMATVYGQAAIVLPLGPFKYCWSPTVEDAYHAFDMGESFTGMAALAKQEEMNIPYLNNINVRTAGGAAGFREFVEGSDEAQNLFAGYMEQAVRKAKYTDKNLGGAMHSGHEIMLSCEKYALVPIKDIVRSYYIQAAEELVKGKLELPENPTMTDFITALSKKVVPIINHGE